MNADKIGGWIGDHKLEAAVIGGVGLAVVAGVGQRFRGSKPKQTQTPAEYLIPNMLVSGAGGTRITVTGPDKGGGSQPFPTTPTPTTPTATAPTIPAPPPPPPSEPDAATIQQTAFTKFVQQLPDAFVGEDFTHKAARAFRAASGGVDYVTGAKYDLLPPVPPGGWPVNAIGQTYDPITGVINPDKVYAYAPVTTPGWSTYDPPGNLPAIGGNVPPVSFAPTTGDRAYAPHWEGDKWVEYVTV